MWRRFCHLEEWDAVLVVAVEVVVAVALFDVVTLIVELLAVLLLKVHQVHCVNVCIGTV